MTPPPPLATPLGGSLWLAWLRRGGSSDSPCKAGRSAPPRRDLPCSLWRPQRRPDGAGEECARAEGEEEPLPDGPPLPARIRRSPSSWLRGPPEAPLRVRRRRRRRQSSAAQSTRSPQPGPAQPPVQDERLELLHRQPDGRRHLPGRRHRGLQGRALRLGRRARQDLRQHHAGRSEHPGGEGAQQPFCERADAGRPEVLGDPGQPAHGRRVHHGPADQEHGRGPHLQHHCCHDQQDDSPGDGQGGCARRLRQQEVLRDGQPLAAITVLMRPPCSACGTTDGTVVRMSKVAATARGHRPCHRRTDPGAGSPQIPALLPAPVSVIFSNAPPGTPALLPLPLLFWPFFLSQTLIAAKLSDCYKV